jgi:plastocyanin
MGTQLLNIPFNVRWDLIAVSQDMMDIQFCNKLFPFEWRSSLAISVFEPKAEDLPEDLCDVITYVKVTCTITGYEPTKDEKEKGYRDFSNDVPTERLQSIFDQYFACYGVLLNVAVFPYPGPEKQLEPICVDFPQKPGTFLPNPYKTGEVTFQTPSDPDNPTSIHIVDNYPQGGDGQSELDLPQEMTVTCPPTPRVEAKVGNLGPAPVVMEAYTGDQLVGSRTARPMEEQVQDLILEGERIDRVIFRAPHKPASLLEFCYYQEKPLDLQNFPHIIDFEPKTRDLYQAATEDGEILSASVSEVKTDKTFTHTDSSETGLSASASASIGIASIGGGLTHKWGETNQDVSQVQTDASRDRREKNATTTNLSQMYNLLTGYHPGTNRAVFLMLARPHVLQPTDYRTFVQGLRYIEGVQDFFLIVARPKDPAIQGLSIEAFLQTGHFPEDVKVCQPEAEYDEGYEDFVVTAQSGRGDDDTKYGDITNFVTSKYTIASGWVIDRRVKRMGERGNQHIEGWDPYHPGIKDLDAVPDDLKAENGTLSFPQGGREPHEVTLYNYQPISDSTVQVSGFVGTKDGIKHFARNFRVYTRAEQPKPSSASASVCSLASFFMTCRTLCVSFKSGDCPKVVSSPPPPPSPGSCIVDERKIEISPALLTREETAHTRLTGIKFVQKDGAEQVIETSPTLLTSEPSRRTRLPAQKELLRKIQSALTSTGSSLSSVPIGSVGFLESEYFKDQIKPYLPRTVLEMELASVPNLPLEMVQVFPPSTMIGGPKTTIGDVLELNLATFARRTGLSVADAARIRYMLLTARPPMRPQIVEESLTSVSIQDNFYSPAHITISRGQVVQWTNNGSHRHTVTSNPGRAGCTPRSAESFDSGELSAGATFTHTFNQAGTFPYHCEIHRCAMAGTITVTESTTGSQGNPPGSTT